MPSVVYSQSIACSRAFALIVEGWNELVQEGSSPDYDAVPPFDSSCSCMHVSSQDGDLIGVLVWAIADKSKVISVRLAYVEPSSRRKGVFRLLVSALRDHAAQVGCPVIVFPVFLRSHPAIRAVEAVGASAVSTVYELPTGVSVA